MGSRFIYNPTYAASQVAEILNKASLFTVYTDILNTLSCVGGSSGIGLSVAVAAIQRGAHVTLIARNRDKLEMAREQVWQNS